jgi:hypothetical protein
MNGDRFERTPDRRTDGLVSKPFWGRARVPSGYIVSENFDNEVALREWMIAVRLAHEDATFELFKREMLPGNLYRDTSLNTLRAAS